MAVIEIATAARSLHGKRAWMYPVTGGDSFFYPSGHMPLAGSVDTLTHGESVKTVYRTGNAPFSIQVGDTAKVFTLDGDLVATFTVRRIQYALIDRLTVDDLNALNFDSTDTLRAQPGWRNAERGWYVSAKDVTVHEGARNE